MTTWRDTRGVEPCSRCHTRIPFFRVKWVPWGGVQSTAGVGSGSAAYRGSTCSAAGGGAGAGGGAAGAGAGVFPPQAAVKASARAARAVVVRGETFIGSPPERRSWGPRRVAAFGEERCAPRVRNRCARGGRAGGNAARPRARK